MLKALWWALTGKQVTAWAGAEGCTVKCLSVVCNVNNCMSQFDFVCLVSRCLSCIALGVIVIVWITKLNLEQAKHNSVEFIWIYLLRDFFNWFIDWLAEGLMINQLIYWLIDVSTWVVGWLISRLSEKLVICFVSKCSCCLGEQFCLSN